MKKLMMILLLLAVAVTLSAQKIYKCDSVTYSDKYGTKIQPAKVVITYTKQKLVIAMSYPDEVSNKEWYAGVEEFDLYAVLPNGNRIYTTDYADMEVRIEKRKLIVKEFCVVGAERIFKAKRVE
jgi:hypothetical protein